MKMFIRKFNCICFACFIFGMTAYSSDIKIKPENCRILLSENADGIKLFAAEELQKHLALITGIKIPVLKNEKDLKKDNFVFRIGIKAPDDKTELSKEEARYKITDNGVYIYGEDEIKQTGKSPLQEAINQKMNHAGTLFAVYSFLENELGVHWIEPGDKGICFKKKTSLDFSEKNFAWKPSLKMRQLRSSAWEWRHLKDEQKDVPVEFRVTEAEAKKKDTDEKVWLRRMRMGRSITLNYGHAFTRWWETYGKSHPEYFAMNEKGERKPWGKPDRIKMCVSSKALRDEIVNQWLSRYKENPDANQTINVCENDSGGYCRCPECMKLDVPVEGEAFGTNLTDRYIWFANHVLREVRKHDPNIRAVMYAYSVYRFPPRREKVDPGVVLGYVPGFLVPPEELKKFYGDWRKAGAKEFFLRPNDMHIDSGLPMGFEKKMFDNFKIGIENGIFATDYDSLHGFWDTSGLANYIIAKGHVYPEKPFEYWEDEYCSVFGNAKEDVKEYFRYWRNIFDERFYPNREEISKAGKYGNFRRGLMWKLSDFYKKDDFDKTDAILEKALKKELSADEKERVKMLVLSNKHARLTFNAILNSGKTEKKIAEEKLASSIELLKFRISNREQLPVAWPSKFTLEREFGDIAGIEWASIFKVDIKPYRRMDISWNFKADPQNVGLKEEWFKTPWNEIKSKWDKIRIDRAWENQKNIKSIPENLRNFLENYDGIGWYAASIQIDDNMRNKEIFLTFGAVDESCWVYINGVEVGKHIFEKPDDWKMPFNIRIDCGLKDNFRNIIIVRVEDKSGAGGIWKPVWISTKDK